jgi:undecaprenyl-diphosphatase
MLIEGIKAFIFGVVEGITEWMPVSSTGHMLILNDLLKLNVSSDFYELYEVVIQLAAILAVFILYFRTIFDFNKDKKHNKKTFNLWGKIIIACIPAGVLGVLFNDIIDKYLFNSIVVAAMLILYGIIFIIFENKNIGTKQTKKLEDVTYSQAFAVGTYQVLSLIPGTSRSGATILGGLLSGFDRKTIADFTFLLAIPIMGGASLLKVLKYIKNVGLVFTTTELTVLIVSCLTAFIVSFFIIKYFLAYIKKNDFKVFGYYRIGLGVVVLLYFIYKSIFV